MKIGKVHITRPLVLAALEEHSNYPFRLVMRQFGAALVCTERVDADAVAAGDRRAMRLLHTTPSEAPRQAQLSGRELAMMAKAAVAARGLGFDMIDLNFECPVRRVLARGEGGALMSEPDRLAAIVAAVVAAVDCPVTVKIRSGPDESQTNAPAIAAAIERAGAAAVCVHARSVAQGYVGGPDWDVIRQVKRAVSIPVIGSGGVRTADDVPRMLTETGCDAVSVARGCLGNPWIFRDAQALLSGSGVTPAPRLAERGRVLVRLVEAEFHHFSPTLARRRLPRVAGYFARWLSDPDAFRAALREVANLNQFRAAVREHFRG